MSSRGTTTIRKTAPEGAAGRGPVRRAEEAWSEEDRRRALQYLTLFSMSGEFASSFRRAVERFWGPLFAELGDEELLRLHADPTIAFNFQGFYAIEHEAAPGRTILELLLERSGSELRDGERSFLRALARSRLGVYEWIAERGCLRDAWRGAEELLIGDAEACGFRPGELVAARLTRSPGGRVSFEWDLYVFPPCFRDELLAELEAECAGRLAGRWEAPERAFSRRAAPVLHQLLFLIAGPVDE